MRRLRLRLLGGFQARLEPGGPVLSTGKKAQALLAFLALRPGHPYSRDALTAILWGDSPDEQARHSLRQTLHNLRQAIGTTRPPALVLEGDTVALHPRAAEVDVTTFERLAGHGTSTALEQATALYEGDLLAGLALREEGFEEWLRAERARLRELALKTLTRLLAHQIENASTESAIETAIRLLALDPLQEETHRTLMRLYARQGRRAAALRQYQICVDMLQRELGAEPEAATRQVYREILPERAAAVPTAAAVSPRATPVRGRGRNRRRAIRLRPSPASLQAPLIGRHAELERAGEILDEAWRGRGAVLVILGEAGVGKTRLVEELSERAVQRGGRVLIGRAYETSRVLPFAPWIDALRAELDTECTALDGLNPAWRAELARLLPEIDAPEPASASGDALRLFEAVTQLVGLLAGAQPLVFIVEDLHWADEMSLRLLAFLGRRLQSWPLLVVATTREEELPEAPLVARTVEELREHARFAELMLGPLSRDDTASLVRSLVAADGSGVPLNREDIGREHLEDHVWKVSEGNPFVVLETVQAFRERSASPESVAGAPPRRVRELVTARLARLSERGRHLAAAASVIGREFDFAVLQHMAGLTDREAAEAVEELVRRRVFRGVGEGLDFVHDRIRQVVLSQLLPTQRKPLHRLAARAIEEVYASNLEPHYTSLATHCLEGEVWDKAVAYFRQAGAQAKSRYAFEQVAKVLEQALAALARLPETRHTQTMAIDLRFDLRGALYQLNEFERIIASLREAEDLARSLDDRQRLGWVLVYLSAAFWIVADWAKVQKYAQNAEALATATGDVRLEVYADYYLGLAALSLGNYRAGEERLQKGLQLLDGSLCEDLWGMVGSPAVLNRSWLAWSFAERGAFEVGIAYGEEGVRIAETLDHPYSRVHVYRNLAWLYVLKGDLGQALRLLERSAQLCREWKLVFLSPVVLRHLGYVSVLSGRVAEGITLLREASAAAEAGGILADRSLALAQLGEAYALAGRFDEAGGFAAQALTLARRRGERGCEAWALRALGEIASRQVPPSRDAAEPSYYQALALAEELEMQPLAARCHLGLGALHQRIDRCG